MTDDPGGSAWFARFPRLLILARLLWIGFAVFTLVVILAAIGPRYRTLTEVSSPDLRPLGQLTTAEAADLARSGLSTHFYAGLFTVLEGLSALAFVSLSAVIFFRSARGGFLLFAAFALLPFGAIASPILVNLAAVHPAWDLPVLLLHALSLGLGVLLIYTFPDGRFAPRWVRWLAVGWLAYIAAWFFYPSLRIIPSLMIGSQTHQRTLLLGIFVLISATGIQLYRYARVSTPTQQQQTKWVVFGLVVFVGGSVLVSIPLLANPDFNRAGAISVYYRMFAFSVVLLGELAFLITFVVAILRYRLWDIDFIIRRTLAYSIVTASLAAIYLASVLLFQGLFTSVSGQLPQAATVLSTLLIVVLFNPLRGRVQAAVDRRFHRSQYDAEQALAEFAAGLQDEADLEALHDRLLAVVARTMEPAALSLWLRRSSDSPHGEPRK